MRIKLFEEYSLDFKQFKDFTDNIYNINMIDLTNIELNKIEKLISIKVLSNFFGDSYYVMKSSNDDFDTIYLHKLPDDYYLVDFYYQGTKKTFKLDQLSELIKFIKYINQ